MSGVAGIIEGFRQRSGEKTFLDRLDDLRGRLIRCALLITVASGGGFYLAMRYDVLGIFTAPVQPYLNGERLKYLSPMDPFFVTLKLAICIGIAATLPYLLYQAWQLVSPIMLPDERRFALPAMFAGVALFVVGIAFCYFLALPLTLRFTLGFQTESLEQSLVIGEYLTFVVRLLAAFGVAFELPIVIVFLTLIGAVTPEFLVSRRRHAIALFLIVSALVTPPDVGSLVLLAIPVILLYELSILLSRMVVSRREATLLASGFE